MIRFFKGIKFRLSDLFLLIGFICFALFAIFGQVYMATQNPDNISFRLYIAIPIFIIGFSSFIVYTILENKRGNLPHILISSLFFIITFSGLLSIFAESTSVSLHSITHNKLDEIVSPITVNLSYEHKFIFAFELILILYLMYAGFFILPKRFSDYRFLLVLCYLVFVLLFVISIYSFVVEYDKFIPFFLILFNFKEGHLEPIYSFVINPNAVGMLMLIGIIMAIIANSIKPRWWYYLLIAYFYIILFFTNCSSSILLSTVIIIFYVYFKLISSFKRHKIKNIIFISIFSTILMFLIIFLSVTLAKNGEFAPHIHHALYLLINFTTLRSRVELWTATLNMLNNMYWLIGRGFGLINLMLTSIANPNAPYVVPVHNAFLAILAEGGVVFVSGFIALLVYVIYVCVKSRKYDVQLVIAISLGVISFFIYCFVETIQYLLYPFIFILFSVYEVNKKSSTAIKCKKMIDSD